MDGGSRSDNDDHSKIFSDVRHLNLHQQEDLSDSKIVLTKLSFSAHKASFISASNSGIMEGGPINLPSRIHKSSSATSIIQQTIDQNKINV